MKTGYIQYTLQHKLRSLVALQVFNVSVATIMFSFVDIFSISVSWRGTE